MAKAGITPLWIERSYNEMLALLQEAKSYNAQLLPHQVAHLSPRERLVATTESLRVTSRLSHLVAWAMNEKAVLANEISRKKANGSFRPLSEEDTCLDDTLHDSDQLPHGLRQLLKRSLALFNRVSRLEYMARSEETPPFMGEGVKAFQLISSNNGCQEEGRHH